MQILDPTHIKNYNNNNNKTLVSKFGFDYGSL